MAFRRVASSLADKLDRLLIALGTMELVAFLVLLCVMGGKLSIAGFYTAASFMAASGWFGVHAVTWSTVVQPNCHGHETTLIYWFALA